MNLNNGTLKRCVVSNVSLSFDAFVEPCLEGTHETIWNKQGIKSKWNRKRNNQFPYIYPNFSEPVWLIWNYHLGEIWGINTVFGIDMYHHITHFVSCSHFRYVVKNISPFPIFQDDIHILYNRCLAAKISEATSHPPKHRRC